MERKRIARFDSTQHITDLATRHYENFPVGRFLKKELRPWVHAIYAFARTADDFADEAEFEGRRLDCLAHWRQRLYMAEDGRYDDALFQTLAQLFKETWVKPHLLHDLLDAFEWDVHHNRHATFDDLLQYARLSANPIGRMLLLLHRIQNEDALKASDAICSALQLTNFWQDVGVDLLKNRIYIPQAELAQWDLREEDLFNPRLSPHYNRMLRSLGERTQALFREGSELPRQLPWPFSYEIRVTLRGGLRMLTKVMKNPSQCLKARPTFSKWEMAWVALRAVK